MSDKALIAPEAEAAILGAMMINNSLIDKASDRISGRDFGEGIHAELFERASLMYASGKPVNPVSLSPFFRENTALADLGGLPYLAKLTADSTGILAFDTFLEQVQDMARRRKTLAALDEARAATIDLGKTDRDVAAAVENAVQISGGGTDITEISAAGAVRALFESYEGQIEGVRCGCIPELDDLFGTIRRKQMVILGGRPGMGKTALAISYAAGAAKQGHGVLFVSLEMGATELAGRLLANWSYDSNPIPYAAIQDGRLTAEDRHRLRSYQAQIEKIPLQIVDASSMTVGRLNMLVRRWKRRFEARGQSLDLVIVDYLQLLRSDRSGQKRYEEVTDVSMAIKGMAKEHDVGLMVLAQLNREVEQRDDKTPRRADLRDSGQLEQDADMILFVMREAYYHAQKKPPKDTAGWHEWMATEEVIKDKIDFILAKRRNGPEGTAVGTFSGQYQAVRGSK
ncbi:MULTISPECIES: DnaB-like helicase C-terminal domain-containing protein [unclassified Blastomonas]|uniref:replicative DNA helicase n=1 Tax=unclassified Blastomonas TaxID=2626550 RepID=UPI0008264D46|nr:MULTISPECIES: DnaB-like helicase C-terminal domain-containing protein [unclassified Blastomonas]